MQSKVSPIFQVFEHQDSDAKDVFLALENRIHAIVTFIALLELLNLQTVELIQGDGVNNFWLIFCVFFIN